MGSRVSTGTSLEQGNGLSPIEVRENRLIVINWETDEADIVSFFTNKPAQDRARVLERTLKVGVVASNVVGTAERMDYVQKEFNSLQTRFNEQLETTLDQLGKTFDDHFGESGRFAQILQDTFGENGKVVKQIFDPNREGTPLFQLKTDLERQIRNLQDALAKKAGAEEIIEKTPIRGLEFEEQVERMLNDIVKQRKGDSLESTTTATGRVTRSKKGDFLLRFGEKPDAPLVIEAKSYEGRLSLPEIQRTLKEAIENRGAAYGILVSKNVEALPGSVGWFNEYGNNQLVIALGESGSDELREEILNIAVTWARFKILLQTPRQGSLDISKLDGSVQRAVTVLGRFREILTQCTNLEKASQTIRGLCEDIKRELQGELTVISTLVNAPQAR